jgi:hypothetical protein
MGDYNSTYLITSITDPDIKKYLKILEMIVSQPCGRWQNWTWVGNEEYLWDVMQCSSVEVYKHFRGT